MTSRHLLLATAFGLTAALPAAQAGPVVYTDFESFRTAAGDVREIDFETLPDGSPSFSGAEITPTFNYTEQGLFFASAAPALQIAGNELSGFLLRAGDPTNSGSPVPNWIIAETVVPARSVGVLLSGGTTLSVYDANEGSLITQFTHGPGGPGIFLGVVSDVPIGIAIMNNSVNFQSINSFYFTPVPEPGSVVLLVIGNALVLLRRRSVRGAS